MPRLSLFRTIFWSLGNDETPLPHPQTGDNRLRTLCATVLEAPAERVTYRAAIARVAASHTGRYLKQALQPG